MKTYKFILVVLISTSVFLEIYLLYIGSNRLQQDLSINSASPIVLRYAIGILTLFLKNALVDVIIYKSTEEFIGRVRKFANYPLTYDKVSDLVSKIQVENTNRRTYFTLPLINIIFDIMFIIVMVLLFAPNLNILNQIFLYLPIIVGTFALLSLVSFKLGEIRFQSQRKYSNILSKNLVSSYVDGYTYKGLIASNSNISLRIATCFVSWLSQSIVSITIVISFALIYIMQIVFGVSLDFKFTENIIFDAVFVVAVYQPALKLFRSVMKLPVGIIANKQFTQSKNQINHDLSECVTVNIDNCTFSIDLDQASYRNTIGLPCPNGIILNKGSILKVCGANGSGKSTLLWNIFKASINTCDAVYVSQNVVAHSENGREASGGEHTIQALEDALTKGYDLVILDEPVNNLDNTNISFLKDLISKTPSSLIIVDHSDKIQFTESIYL